MAKRGEYDTAKTRLERYHRAWDLVQIQAENEGLWMPTTDNIEVAMLQQELRRLHAVIEDGE